MSRLKLTELRLRHYRAFTDARLALSDVTFLVGRNGAGKSTLMDALRFVNEAVTDSLGIAFERRGNLMGLFPRHLLNQSRIGVSVAVCFEAENETRGLYGFTVGINPPPPGYVVKKEVLRAEFAPSFERDGDGFRSRSVPLDPVLDPETLVLPLIAGSNELWKKLIEALRLISVHQFSPQAIRSEPKIGNKERLSVDGDNAGDVLKRLKLKDRRWIEERLARAVPGIKDIQTDSVVGRRRIIFAQAGAGGKVGMFEASAMSDGTLRSLAVLLALTQTPRPSIVLIDEIEDSLHPHAHGVLLDAIEAASEEFPAVVSTHSPEILSHPSARGDRIRIVQWNEGTSGIYCLSEQVLASLQPPQTVGRLLRSNALWTDAEPAIVGAESDFFKL
jgi:predicted ATPase